MSFGHGCYKVYLHKHDHDVEEACPKRRNENETARHVFFTCPQYVNQRNWLERTIELKATPDNIVNLMLISCDNWNAICAFVRSVLMQQRLTDRERSAKLEIALAEPPPS